MLTVRARNLTVHDKGVALVQNYGIINYVNVTYAAGRKRNDNEKNNQNSTTVSDSFPLGDSFLLFTKYLPKTAFNFDFGCSNDHCHYPVDKGMASMAQL